MRPAPVWRIAVLAIGACRSEPADEVIVFTSQGWTRPMSRRDGVTPDAVRTTRRYREVRKEVPPGGG